MSAVNLVSATATTHNNPDKLTLRRVFPFGGDIQVLRATGETSELQRWGARLREANISEFSITRIRKAVAGTEYTEAQPEISVLSIDDRQEGNLVALGFVEIEKRAEEPSLFSTRSDRGGYLGHRC